VAIGLADSRRLRLSGRIDRIDRVGPHAYRIVDYKTGRYWDGPSRGLFGKGTQLQHAVYGVAAETLLARTDPGARVVGSLYAYPTARGWGREVRLPRPDERALQGVLTDLVGLIGAGVFTQTADERTCEWCPFSAACGREPWAAAGRKHQANAGGRLDAWLRLKEHL
jgi:ATP-dependent helicase/DNAse subunit B